MSMNSIIILLMRQNYWRMKMREAVRCSSFIKRNVNYNRTFASRVFLMSFLNLSVDCHKI